MRRILNLVIILVGMGIILSTSRSIWALWRAGDKLGSKEVEVERLKKEKDRLVYEVEKRQKPLYIEEAAREKLSMVKENEVVVIVKGELIASQSAKRLENDPNWKRWKNLFF